MYLDDQFWGTVHTRACRENTTISELVRQAAQDLGDCEQRRTAMQRFVSIRKSRAGDVDSIEEVRRLRHGSRLIYENQP